MREEAFDLVLTGLQSDDQGHAQTGVVLAERLGIAHATIIMEVQVEDGRLRVKRELEGGWFQWIALPLPALLTIQSGINQLRYATLKGIMAAKKKEVRKVTPAAPLVAGSADRSPLRPGTNQADANDRGHASRSRRANWSAGCGMRRERCDACRRLPYPCTRRPGPKRPA